MKFKDLTAQSFGQLTVLSVAGRQASYVTWTVRCACGVEKIVSGHALRNGSTVSCGCLRASRMLTLGRSHGMSRSRTYTSWAAMIGRCERASDVEYKNYGGRGISVCEKWHSFESFLSDMGERPPGKTIDRYPDNNGNYEPGNCRWASTMEQGQNKRSARMIAHDGLTLSLSEWARRLGISKQTLSHRIRAGLVGTSAFTAPARVTHARRTLQQ